RPRRALMSPQGRANGRSGWRDRLHDRPRGSPGTPRGLHRPDLSARCGRLVGIPVMNGGRTMNLNGVLIGSENPERLAEYYARLFGKAGWESGGFVGWQLGTGWLV